MKETVNVNIGSQAFTLDEDDMAKIRALDTKTSQFFSHRDPAIMKWMSTRHIEH